MIPKCISVAYDYHVLDSVYAYDVLTGAYGAYQVPIPVTEYPPVLTKHDFVRRYEAGEFGNRAPTWNSFLEWNEGRQSLAIELERAGVLYHIRNRVAGGETYYNVNPTELSFRWYNLIESGVPESSLYLSEMAPTKKTLIQGEVMRNEKGLTFFYSTLALPMRDALKKDGRVADGITALTLLMYYLNPVSYDWLEVLMDRYPDHVIELSVYGKEWGTLPGYNTVYWEIRKY